MKRKTKLSAKMVKFTAMLCTVSMLMPSVSAFAEGNNENYSGQSIMSESSAEVDAQNLKIENEDIESQNSPNESVAAETKAEQSEESENNESETKDMLPEESKKNEPETDLLSEESNDESEEDTEAESVEESETESDDAEKSQRENSWRFEDGIWLGAYGISAYEEISPDAWTKVNGSYVNIYGDIIPGVVARGIDVSEWQSTIDWIKVMNDDVSFAIIRCGAGQNYDDKYWEKNAAACERLGLPYGTYLYSYAQSKEDAINEAKHVLRLVSGKNLSYPIYFDMEDDSLLNEITYEEEVDPETGETEKVEKKRQRTAAELAEIARAFCDTIEAAGYEVQIYSNLYWANNYLTDSYFSKFTEWWIAQYNYQCNYKGSYALWQCTSSGSIDGINGNVDINMLYSEEYDQRFAVRGFVKRLYSLVLGRQPDTKGLDEWVNILIQGDVTGAEVVRDFVYSPEFIGKNVSNEEYIDILYKTCLDRVADNSGRSAWLERFEDGFSSKYILKGFIESQEFSGICGKYGIVRGSIELTEYRDQNDGITKFVTRCYKLFLDRKPDTEGLNNWAKLILEDKNQAKTLPEGFVFSKEFQEMNVSNEDYVKICYRAILNREADSKGLASWIKRLEAGDSRRTVCEGFTESIEFKELLEFYGL